MNLVWKGQLRRRGVHREIRRPRVRPHTSLYPEWRTTGWPVKTAAAAFRDRHESFHCACNRGASGERKGVWECRSRGAADTALHPTASPSPPDAQPDRLSAPPRQAETLEQLVIGVLHPLSTAVYEKKKPPVVPGPTGSATALGCQTSRSPDSTAVSFLFADSEPATTAKVTSVR